MTKNAEGNRLRKGRVSIPGQIYSITTVTHMREPVFNELYAARALINILKNQSESKHALTLCFVVMPDHIHWLMELGHSRTLSQTVQSVKSKSSKYIGTSIWQKGFHDRAIRRDEDVASIARYIVANPLRAGLVTTVKDYPHWDCIWL